VKQLRNGFEKNKSLKTEIICSHEMIALHMK
jgi:hypothetical protein